MRIGQTNRIFLTAFVHLRSVGIDNYDFLQKTK